MGYLISRVGVLPLIGASGGIIIIWDTRLVSKIEVIHGIFTLSVRVEVKGYGEWLVSVVYWPSGSWP